MVGYSTINTAAYSYFVRSAVFKLQFRNEKMFIISTLNYVNFGKFQGVKRSNFSFNRAGKVDRSVSCPGAEVFPALGRSNSFPQKFSCLRQKFFLP